MRIVLVSGFGYPDGGPGATRTLTLAHALADAGHEVVFVLTQSAGPPDVDGGDRFRWYSTGAERRLTPFGWRLSLATDLGPLLSRLHAESALTAVWVVNRDPWTLRTSRRAGRTLGVPVVHELTEYPDITDASPVRARLETRWLTVELSRLDGLLVISRALAEVAAALGVERVLLTGPMVLSREPPAPEPGPGPVRIGYAGAISQRKDGVLDLVDAFAALRRQRPGADLELVLLGDGPDLTAARARAAQLGVAAQVQLRGSVPALEVAAVLRSCHVLALPRPDSHQARGGFPTKLGEYLATGRPVVATVTGDVGCYLEDRVSGYLVPPGDPAALTEALAAVLDDPASAALVGAGGYALCRGSFAAATRVTDLTDFLAAWSPTAPGAGRPVVVQHCVGEPGQGGPATALARLEQSALGERYRFVRITQQGASGSIDLARIWRWARQIRGLNADVVHVRGLGNEGFHAALAARLGGARRVLLSVHGSVRDVQRPTHPLRALVVIHLLEPLTLLLSTDVVTVCQAMLGRRFLAPFRGRLRGVVPNGVALPPAAPDLRRQTRTALGLSAEQTVVVVVGRLSVEKGHLVLAEALARPGRAALTLLVVGEGPDRDEIEAAYAAGGGTVRLLGQQADVTPYLAAADLFVLPSLHENLSNALIEAMAAGLPVVATAVGGNVEVLGHGGGVLVPAGDSGALRSALEDLALDPGRRADLGRRARRTVAQHYSLAQMVDSWDDLYAELVTR